MVTCQSSELGWEVTVELLSDFLSLGRGSVTADLYRMRSADLCCMMSFDLYCMRSVDLCCMTSVKGSQLGLQRSELRNSKA